MSSKSQGIYFLRKSGKLLRKNCFNVLYCHNFSKKINLNLFFITKPLFFIIFGKLFCHKLECRYLFEFHVYIL